MKHFHLCMLEMSSTPVIIVNIPKKTQQNETSSNNNKIISLIKETKHDLELFELYLGYHCHGKHNVSLS